MKKLFSFRRSLCTALSVMALACCMSTVAWANNHSDTSWDFTLTYKDSSTSARAKEDSSASYVYYKTGDLDCVRAAIYAYKGSNVTTESGYVVKISKGNTSLISNTGYYARDDHMVCLHLCTKKSGITGSASGVWSPDNYAGSL